MDEVSEEVIAERELEKEQAVAEDENLMIVLLFAHDFKKNISWIAHALKAQATSVKETATILQGYGYLIIVKTDGKEYLRMTGKGINLVAKIRANLKAT